MADKLIYIPKDDTQNLLMELNKPINKKSPKVLIQRIRKRYYKTSVINSPLSPLSLNV